MVVVDLMDILREANPESPILLSYGEFVFEADAVEVRNGIVYIQGY